ncbi:response regulator [Sansalvadorimonas verongulae]|uniref:response regulator n=1 Tax=Sansalvadorimonas verongulae TaxID=2172824 RepID=UPI0012BCB6A9|nr:response regulator [Sansalvadorimonas verongulae]MTI14369.1 response regulator [Sansalvadorimonas verongulae]
MNKFNVICVDDQPEVLNAVQQDLKPLKQWLNIEECESAAEALELMEELDAEGQMVAVVISDHVMPDKTGVELLAEIAADPRFEHTRRVLLTGQATHIDTINAINQAGIHHYFDKPWNVDKLVGCVRSLVTSYVFDAGMDYSDYREFLDAQMMLRRLRIY